MAISFGNGSLASSSVPISTSLWGGGGETRVGVALGKVRSQYREAEHFLNYVAAVLTQVDEAARAIGAVPSFFDIDTAVGEQLTFIGKRLGFPRCHCVCDAAPMVGFACEADGSGVAVAGFCDTEATWRGCGGVSDLCLNDDDVYRAHLVARRYQMLALFDLPSLGAAVRAIWGSQAWIPEAKGGRVVVAPGRDLTDAETRRFAITLRVLPIAPTMEIAVHYGAAPIIGFGLGWAGICTPSGNPDGEWLCPSVVDPYRCDDPLPQLIGFEGPDDTYPAAGFGDADAKWLACL